MTAPTRSERAEGAILVAILVVVGGAAGWASFTHVHDWTMTNSPAGTPDAFGWVNACVSELVPVAALLEIRRRRRKNAPVGYPLALLVAAAGLSLAAQLAVAKPGLSGAILSAVPALAFMALVKLVLATKPGPVPPAEAVPPAPAIAAPALATVPIDRPAEAIPVPAPAMATAVPPATPRRTAPARTRTAPARGGTRPSDAELRAVLADPERVPREADGTVPVKRAARVLGTGVDRARRLLDEAGLRTPVPAAQAVPVPA